MKKALVVILSLICFRTANAQIGAAVVGGVVGGAVGGSIVGNHIDWAAQDLEAGISQVNSTLSYYNGVPISISGISAPLQFKLLLTEIISAGCKDRSFFTDDGDFVRNCTQRAAQAIDVEAKVLAKPPKGSNEHTIREMVNVFYAKVIVDMCDTIGEYEFAPKTCAEWATFAWARQASEVTYLFGRIQKCNTIEHSGNFYDHWFNCDKSELLGYVNGGNFLIASQIKEQSIKFRHGKETLAPKQE